MAATTDSVRARRPRDLKILALLASLWAAALAARIVLHDLADYATMPLQAVALGIRFEGYPARLVLVIQAMVVSTAAIGLGARRRWGLVLAFIYLAESVFSNLIFMTSYMGDLANARNVRLAGLGGIIAVLVMLYLWVRTSHLLWNQKPDL